MATIADLIPGTVQLMGNRSDAAALATQAIGDTIVELTDNYPFEELRETGPLVQFTPGINTYQGSFFVQLPIVGQPPHIWNKTISWFFYLQPPINLTVNPQVGYANPGYNLVYKSPSDMEVLLNTTSLPQFWTQLGNNNVMVAATPNQAYFTYQRYQFKHFITSPIALNTDVLFIPSTWYDIVQYGAAERIALKLRMSDVVTRYHTVIFGDPEFERSSGAKGQPGLIARRTSQTQKNQSLTTRSIRMIGRSAY